MKEYITIHHIGPLIRIERVELRPYTFIIGESASGKSTLMKLISMMRYLFKMANIRSYLRHSKITKSPFRLRFDSMMKETEMLKMLCEDSLVEYEVLMEDDTSYQIRVVNKKLQKLPTIAPHHLAFDKIAFISEHRNLIPAWTQRASQNVGASLGFYFHETNDCFVGASENDQEVALGYVGMKMQISHPKGKPTRYQIVPTDGRHAPIELSEASSGIQTSASVALIVKNFATSFSFKEAFKRSVLNYLYDMDRLNKFQAVTEPSELRKQVYVHIEEPELSLFPDAQCSLMDELIYAATHALTDRKLHLMVATHSPYILNYLNVILRQNKEQRASLTGEQMAVYRIYEGEVQNLLARDERGKWIVDTFDLSEMMNQIYEEYRSLES